ncbi:MAG: S9 family peptidase [Myxococcales bacterium]|nr:MAG: S9 family peptidase [Myxococcales bacterium]
MTRAVPVVPAPPVASAAPLPKAPRFTYPPSARGPVEEVLHGVTVRDPYRWLEDVDSPATRAWVEAQNAVTRGYLDGLPRRTEIRGRLRELWDYERYELPFERGGRYFYFYNSGLQNQPALYWMPSLGAEPRLLLDPNTLSADGTVALMRAVPSEDGKLLAYGLSRAGSDWLEWRVRRVDTAQDLPDVLRWSKFSTVSWLTNGSGFYYTAYDEPAPGSELSATNYYNKLLFHRLGQKQSEDRLIYERKDRPKWAFGAQATRDGRYVVITATEGTDPKNAILYLDLRKPPAPPTALVPRIESLYDFIGNRGSIFWFRTDESAPRGRVVSLDVAQREPKLVEVVPEQPETLRQVERVSDKFLLNYLKDAHAELRAHAIDGKLEHTVPLPGFGTVWLAEGDEKRSETFYSYESYQSPRKLLRYDVKTRESQVFREPKLKMDPDAFETRQVFYASKDGTRIPMFVTQRKGAPASPDAPCLLYGYGGFSISLTPSFSVSNLTWLDLGGTLAVPNLRGGGEYGEAWHEAGKRAKKQNVFDDFIAAAEYLIREKLTSSPHLGILGRSNGGLLVGAMLAQRPELFGAALPGVGVMDMLRFHKFTIGWSWTDDYGSPDDPADFPALFAYSPLHNLREGVKYPATLITTGDHDDRVVPGHSFKFAAALQRAQAGDAPVMIRIETRAGHGAGIPTEKKIDEVADQWAFLWSTIGPRP